MAETVPYTFRALYEWSRDFHWSKATNFVYWNNGLWDVVKIFGEENQTPLIEYKNLIARTFDRLKYLFPQAKIIFATTTPVIESRFEKEKFFRSNEDIKNYNAAAQEIILSKGGLVHDLYSLTADWDRSAYSDSTHFNEQANKILAINIAILLKNFLYDF